MSQFSPEKVILTRLFTAQRRLRYVRGLAQSLRWFAAGAVLSTLALVLLWNWDRLPGPWQWLASAGRPRELLWLPLLLAIGGFASRWLALPSVRDTAHRVDALRGSQERLLTAVDWILTEKPRTAVSERLLGQAARDLEDERGLRADLLRLEGIPRKSYSLLLTIALPVAVLFFLPPHVGLPQSAAVWLGPNQVDRLTEALLEELEKAQGMDQPEEKLKELLKGLERSGAPEADEKALEQAKRELQRALDRIEQGAKAQESARQLLETLAQRARQGQGLSEEDKKALEELKQMMSQPGQRESLERAESEWSQGNNEEAAQQLESMQQEAGAAARRLEDMAAEGQSQAEGKAAPGSGQEFNEAQGDQHPGEGEPGQGQGRKAGQEAGPGEGEGGDMPGDFGKGTTEEEQQGGPASGRQSRRQSERTSEKSEEFQNLNPPLRTEIETSQSKVGGAAGAEGPRYRTDKEGRGKVTEPADLESGGGLLEYRESAENALLREEIPADYREDVRLYFEALDK